MRGRSKYSAGLEGRKIGHQTIISRAPNRNGAVTWIVRCACGVERQVCIRSLMERGKQNACATCSNRLQTGPKSKGWRGGVHVPLTFYNRFKKNAERRDIEWSLSISDLDALFARQHQLCALTMEQLYFEHGGSDKSGNASLDRKISARGYIANNIQFVTKSVNMAKQSMSNQEFAEMCILVVNRLL
jgi:hypothetical protein